MSEKTSPSSTDASEEMRKHPSIDPVNSMNMPPPAETQKQNDENILHVSIDFELFFDRPSRNDAGQIDEIGTNYWKFKGRDVSIKVEEDLLVADLGQIVVEQTLRLQPGSRYMVDSTNIWANANQLLPINAQEEFVTAGAHYSMIIYRI